MKGKTILITGAAGFLGSHLAEKLAEENRVIAVDIANNLPQDIKESLKFYEVDIADPDIIAEVFRKERPQTVYHLAGPISLRREIDDPLFKKSLNILGNLSTILNCCTKYEAEKIIFFSSGGAIYEEARTIPTPENYPAHPASLYGLANLIIERYIKSYQQKYGLNFTILRFGNVYGPRQWENGIIPSIIIKVLKGESPVIYGKGNQTRDFIFVDDAITAALLAIKDNKNQIYNVGSGKEININEIFNKITKILHKKIEPVYNPSKIDEVERSCLDSTKIKKELEWKPKINIDQGLKKTIDWFKLKYGR